MSRYILLNESGDTEAALALVATMSDVQLLDRTDDRALLVEASTAQAEELGRRLVGWKVRAETTHAKPAPPFPRGRWKI